MQRFRNITLPMILFATAPVMITQYTFNFNNFSIIYLFNEGGREAREPVRVDRYFNFLDL